MVNDYPITNQFFKIHFFAQYTINDYLLAFCGRECIKVVSFFFLKPRFDEYAVAWLS